MRNKCHAEVTHGACSGGPTRPEVTEHIRINGMETVTHAIRLTSYANDVVAVVGGEPDGVCGPMVSVHHRYVGAFIGCTRGDKFGRLAYAAAPVPEEGEPLAGVFRPSERQYQPLDAASDRRGQISLLNRAFATVSASLAILGEAGFDCCPSTADFVGLHHGPDGAPALERRRRMAPDRREQTRDPARSRNIPGQAHARRVRFPPIRPGTPSVTPTARVIGFIRTDLRDSES